MIYFIACEDLVKIGTASNVRARLSRLQTGNPKSMTLLCEVPGDRAAEADLHQRFSSFRVRGEWFRYDGELRAFIERAVAAGVIAEDVTAPYSLFDGDSSFLGLFDQGGSGLLVRAYAQAHRAVLWSSVGQWWRFGCDWEEGTNPVGHDPVELYKGEKTVLCALRDAGAFQVRESALTLQRLLKKAREFAP